MSSAEVRLDMEATGVARLTLVRQAQHNALNRQMVKQLSEHLKMLAADETVRVLVLQGEGRHFCSGADLVEMREQLHAERHENLAVAESLAALLAQLNAFPVPTIARVQGAAYGGGLGLLCCCDMVVASDHSRFCMSEVKLGISPAMISRYVIEAIGLRQARRYCLSAEVIDAQQALQLQLVHQLAAEEELEQVVAGYCQQILACGPQAIAATKQLLGRYPVTEARNYAQQSCQLIATLRVSAEGQEGLSAFLEGRSAQFDRSSEYRKSRQAAGERRE
ncbi:methylglutaconyl-CoA hydratase [Sinobacterium caligoides]|uniref:Methylglutaconyl-CoA hydratase n=1 Tax=Sinobacterium caligoides TaxID=933926 RepID=A0A3N2DN37_9GAMM|nr:enoyl-CoA hydratase-related protein [Sinobacterium caligoides]ROS01227.1 methylglutaconyl-CoA hydratase [Sinobacterium caligoides]